MLSFRFIYIPERSYFFIWNEALEGVEKGNVCVAEKADISLFSYILLNVLHKIKQKA